MLSSDIYLHGFGLGCLICLVSQLVSSTEPGLIIFDWSFEPSSLVFLYANASSQRKGLQTAECALTHRNTRKLDSNDQNGSG